MTEKQLQPATQKKYFTSYQALHFPMINMFSLVFIFQTEQKTNEMGFHCQPQSKDYQKLLFNAFHLDDIGMWIQQYNIQNKSFKYKVNPNIWYENYEQTENKFAQFSKHKFECKMAILQKL